MEEVKAGNLERECLEEKCIKHEFDEIYDVDEFPTAQQAKRQQEVDNDWRAQTSACEVSKPCVKANSLDCTNFFGGYDCKCKKGWAGKNCEKDINECDTSDWCNGGNCVNQDGGFVCECPSGWHGERCTFDIDECDSRDNVCGDNGSCDNNQGGFTCDCKKGWTGSKCDEDVDECLEDPCSRKEVCKNSVGSYECVCTGGKTGHQCLSDLDECSLNPCGSKMTCINEGNSYRCECSDDGCELDNAYDTNNFVMIDVEDKSDDEIIYDYDSEDNSKDDILTETTEETEGFSYY